MRGPGLQQSLTEECPRIDRLSVPPASTLDRGELLRGTGAIGPGRSHSVASGPACSLLAPRCSLAWKPQGFQETRFHTHFLVGGFCYKHRVQYLPFFFMCTTGTLMSNILQQSPSGNIFPHLINTTLNGCSSLRLLYLFIFVVFLFFFFKL